MRDLLYKEIVARLKAITIVDNEYIINTENTSPAIQHFGIWNEQLQNIEAEIPFYTPAIFIEFMPINWTALGNNVKVVDLGADFRLDDSDNYEKWYKVKHEFPEINAEAVYGLPELYKDEIAKARIVASPGCYPTSAILGVAPLLKNNIVDTRKIIVDSKSGVSGAGRSANIATLFTEVNESFKAYNILKHRHTPEIKQEIDKLSNSNINLVFTPHLLPINRGILSTIYLDAKIKTTEKEIIEMYKEFYKDSPFVRVIEELPEIKNIKNTNICEISIRYDEENGNIVVISAIDNLIKGAGGQGVQSMNIMFGFDEMEGLEFLSMFI